MQNNKITAAITWIFTPITSLILYTDKDSFVQWHAKQSLYYGVISAMVYFIGFVLTFFLGLLPSFLSLIVICLQCLLMLWFFADLAIRIVGAWKAYSGEKWSLPFISKLVS